MSAKIEVKTPSASAQRTLPDKSLRVRAWVVDRLGSDILPGFTAAVLATVIGIWALQLWKANLKVPFVIGPGDDLFNLVAIKDVITHGWDLTNPSLGVPFGQELYDFPAFSGDSFYMMIIKALGVFFGNPAVVTNLFYLLGFPLIATSGFVILRRLGISIGAAIVCAVLYALLPYRLDSYETHIFLSSYFVVPVCSYLILAVFGGAELFARDPRRTGLWAYLTPRTAAILLLCVVIGSADNYFALFTVVLMVPAATLAFLVGRGRRPLVCGLIAVMVILGAVALNGLPTVIYQAEHGPNTIPSARLPQETDIWGLTLANLVMPIEGSRIGALSSLAHEYNSTIPAPESSPTSEPGFTNLGIVGTLGLVWLAVILGIRCVGGGSGVPEQRRGVHAALGAGMSLLIGTVGGLATLFAYIVDPQLHAPARIVVFIAFFALFGAALALDRIRIRLNGRPGARPITIAMLVAVLVVGVLYQTSPSMVPDYRTEISEYEERAKFVRAIESQVPANASIFQLPYVPFPQGQDPPGILAYQNLYVYFVSKDLRWSGGAMEGRPANWAQSFSNQPLPQVLEGVSAIGFSGLYVEPAGIPNSAEELQSLQRELGVAPLVGAEGQVVFFNMARYNRRFQAQHPAAQVASIAAAALHSAS